MKIAIAGLGTVGKGVYDYLIDNDEVVSKRSGENIEIVAVSARSKSGKDINFDKVKWYDNALDMAEDENIDTVVELIGGDSGVALDLFVKSLKNNKNVVTANKAIMSKHGNYLAKLAEENNVHIYYEAAVAGGIPVVKTIKEGLSSNNITSILGILNGTCNYILTQMEKNSLSFNDALKDAQKLGYAEADPSFDIGGIDAAHKISILSCLAFGSQIDFETVDVVGIENIDSNDIKYAGELGFKIRLIAESEIENNKVKQRVRPFLIANDNILANVNGPDNAVLIKGDMIGDLTLIGPGAGKLPTASAVIADIIDLASKRYSNILSFKTSDIIQKEAISSGEFSGKYYIKINVEDGKGVLSSATKSLKDRDISVEQIIQKNVAETKTVDILIITDIAKESDITEVEIELNRSEYIKKKVNFISVGYNF